jgi:Holliday junction resolvase RusA-like endonuclease
MTTLFDVAATTPAPAPAGAGPAELTITVHGTPAGQGAVSFMGKGRPPIHTNQKKLKPWRAAVSDAAQIVAGTHPYTGPPRPKKKPGEETPKAPKQPCTLCGTMPSLHGLLVGPVGIEVTVSVEQSAAAAKRGDVWPANRTSSDIDHHARAVLDALTHASVWRDDAQVVELTARKVWAGGVGLDALDEPGCVIRVWQLPLAVA